MGLPPTGKIVARPMVARGVRLHAGIPALCSGQIPVQRLAKFQFDSLCPGVRGQAGRGAATRCPAVEDRWFIRCRPEPRFFFDAPAGRLVGRASWTPAELPSKWPAGATARRAAGDRRNVSSFCGSRLRGHPRHVPTARSDLR